MSIVFVSLPSLRCHHFSFFFFFNDTATTEIYTLSLHDALPISGAPRAHRRDAECPGPPARSLPGERRGVGRSRPARDRKSTRLNSSHLVISYAVFCLKKKKNNKQQEFVGEYIANSPDERRERRA